MDGLRRATDASNASNGTGIGTVSHHDSLGTYLGAGGMRRAIDSANGLGSQTEMSEGQTDALRAQTDTSSVSNGAETDAISHGESVGTYLGAEDAKRDVDETDGFGSHADVSSGYMDAPSVRTDAIRPANATQIVSIPRTKPKPPDLPDEGARSTPDEPNGFYSHADTSDVHMDVQSGGNERKTAVNTPERVRTHPNNSKPPDSPARSARECTEHPNRLGSRADTMSGRADVPSVHTDAHSVETDAYNTENETGIVRTCQNGRETQNSPDTREIATLKRTY